VTPHNLNWPKHQTKNWPKPGHQRTSRRDKGVHASHHGEMRSFRGALQKFSKVSDLVFSQYEVTIQRNFENNVYQTTGLLRINIYKTGATECQSCSLTECPQTEVLRLIVFAEEEG
jgi:hypothetical protein